MWARAKIIRVKDQYKDIKRQQEEIANIGGTSYLGVIIAGIGMLLMIYLVFMFIRLL
jgi:hypothetical protein